MLVGLVSCIVVVLSTSVKLGDTAFVNRIRDEFRGLSQAGAISCYSVYSMLFGSIWDLLPPEPDDMIKSIAGVYGGSSWMIEAAVEESAWAWFLYPTLKDLFEAKYFDRRPILVEALTVVSTGL